MEHSFALKLECSGSFFYDFVFCEMLSFHEVE